MINTLHRESKSANKNFIKMTVGLALLGLVNAITIDNQLVMTQNECYQRIAIGERIPDANVYKVFDVRTVDECQFECSKANEHCMALSFGISARGNTSCFISEKSIVNDVKMISPLDSVRDPDFDLFSKKADCRPKPNPDGFNQRPNYDRPQPPPDPYDRFRPPHDNDIRPYGNSGPNYNERYGPNYNERRPLSSGSGPSIISYGHDNHGGMVTSIITEIVDDTSTTVHV